MLLCAWVTHLSLGDPISYQMAYQAAEGVLLNQHPTRDLNAARTIVARGMSTKSIQQMRGILANDLVGYAVNLEPRGFVLLRSDTEAFPLKLSSDEGSYEQLPSGLRAAIEDELRIELAIIAARRSGLQAPNNHNVAAWQSLSSRATIT